MDITINNINTYADIYNVFKTDAYLNILKHFHKKAVERIKKKKKIKIAFQTSFLSTWVGDEIVKMFMSNPRFEVKVVLVWQINSDRNKEMSQLFEHFQDSGIPYVYADGSIHPGDFDIIMYTSPYTFVLENWHESEIPLTTLVCYIPYGVYVANIPDMQYNLFLHNICWKKFSLQSKEHILQDRYCGIGSYGLIFSGYPKLDKLLNPDCRNNAEWKTLKPDAKKIIFAPHHSINETPFVSTFAKNYMFFLEYASEHTDTTSWIFKPHPLLGLSCVKNGIFSSMEEWDLYCQTWDRLPNAKFVEGEYMSWFASSDAMIFDSMSFISEYLYVNKPALFLTRDGESFNEYGIEVLKSYYHSKGDDYNSIMKFIELDLKNDNKETIRKEIFNNLLDYNGINGVSATNFIYRNIVNEFINDHSDF